MRPVAKVVLFILVPLGLLVLLGFMMIVVPKNDYQSSDLTPFRDAANWTVFSIYPVNWEISDPFAEPVLTPSDDPSIPPRLRRPGTTRDKIPPGQDFHDFSILGQTTTPVTAELKTVVADLDHAGRHWSGGIAACFFPRHGLRVVQAGVNHDLLICYECMTAHIYRDNQQIGTLSFSTESKRKPKPDALNELLLKAGVKLPKEERY